MNSAPSPIPGRKGQTSVANIVIHVLWPACISEDLPSKSLGDLQAICRAALAFDLSGSTLRSTLYRHPEIFEKACETQGKAFYRLTRKFIESNHEK